MTAPAISEEELKAARRMGLLGAGLSLLESSGPSITPRGPFSGLLNALRTGREFYGQALEPAIARAEAASKQQAAQQRAALFGQLGITGTEELPVLYGKLQQGLQLALQAGDERAGQQISQVLSSLGGAMTPREGKGLMKVETGDKVMLVDPVTGEPVREFTVPRSATDRPRRLIVTTGPDGKPRYEEYDPYSGSFRPTGRTPAGSRGLTEGQAKARAFFESVDADTQAMNSVITGMGGQEKLLAAAGTGQLGSLLRAGSENAQVLNNASMTLAEAWLRLTTGGAYNADEFRNAVNRYQIGPFDKPATVKWKLDNARRLQQSLRIIANDPEAAASFGIPRDRQPTPLTPQDAADAATFEGGMP